MPASPATAVTVRPTQGRADLRRFIDFGYTRYHDNPYFVPPLRHDVAKTLDPKKNAFFEHGQIQPFLALDEGGEVVGRVAAIVNGEHLKKYDDGNGFFGFFETVDDPAVARALLDAAADWLRARGLTGMRGPANPSLNDTAGLLVDGFDREPALLMPYNPPSYEGYLLDYGFERAMTMWAYYVHKKYVKTDKLRRGAALVQRRNPNLRIRTLDMKRLEAEAQVVLEIYNEAWSQNWGHVPMTEGELTQLIGDLKQVVVPEMVFFVEDDGVPVAFAISLPNLNLALKHVQDGRLFPTGLPKLLAYSQFGGIYEVRMPLMGVRRAYQGRGLDALLILSTIDQGPKIGFDACEMSWILDSNHVMKNALESLGGVVDKEYALYEARL